MSRIPGAKALAAAYFEDFDKIAGFYNGDYRDPGNFVGRSDLVKSRDLPLPQLVPILREQNQSFGCGSHTLERINLLVERQACAVVTGQQTGLFGGPLFTIYKALTAIKLAERLNRNCEGCYVPIFWLASDDHDFREVNHINILNKANQPLTIAFEDHPLDARTPVADIELTGAIKETIRQLADETHPSEFKDDVLSALSATYKDGAGFSAAFGAWLTALCKSFGLILIDASDPRIKALGKSVFRREIAEESPSTQAALLASQRLEASGYDVQVPIQEGVLNLFRVENGRHALELDDGRFREKGSQQSFTKDALLGEVENRPEIFSPNVLLRPIYQDALLPTLAYVAGPAEIAYYAQMKGIYEAFDLPMPIIYPRKSVTLVETRIEKILEQYSLQAPDFWSDPEVLISDIVKTQLPEDLEKRIENAIACVNKNLEALENVVVEFEPTLESTVANTRGRMVGQIDGLTKKITQAYKKRNEIISQQIHKASNSLYPNRQLQERELNIVPYLFKYGFGFVDRLYEAIDVASFEHQVITI